jgi:hypothetical protein
MVDLYLLVINISSSEGIVNLTNQFKLLTHFSI